MTAVVQIVEKSSVLVINEAKVSNAADGLREGAPELCVVVPTFNECDNVAVLAKRLDTALRGIDWEVIFVDDDSPDETSQRVRALAVDDRRIRCIRRVGRRGLSSACIEGMLATSAPFVAVIDGDLQHDEALLPSMLQALKQAGADVAVGSRYVESGSSEGLSSDRRKRLSLYGIRLAQRLLKAEIADPASGFFMVRRELFEGVVPRLSGVGMKILIDLLASSPRRLSIVELPYRFRPRHSGESKLDTLTGIEYILLLAEKLSHRYFPHRLLLFGLVGASGLVVNLVVLRLLMLGGGVAFTAAEAIATMVAMISNFVLNNLLTYRDCRLRGWQAVRGLVSFAALCSLGAVATVAVARDIYQLTGAWLAAALGGAVIGALLNYASTSIFTWRRQT